MTPTRLPSLALLSIYLCVFLLPISVVFQRELIYDHHRFNGVVIVPPNPDPVPAIHSSQIKVEVFKVYPIQRVSEVRYVIDGSATRSLNVSHLYLREDHRFRSWVGMNHKESVSKFQFRDYHHLTEEEEEESLQLERSLMLNLFHGAGRLEKFDIPSRITREKNGLIGALSLLLLDLIPQEIHKCYKERLRSLNLHWEMRDFTVLENSQNEEYFKDFDTFNVQFCLSSHDKLPTNCVNEDEAQAKSPYNNTVVLTVQYKNIPVMVQLQLKIDERYSTLVLAAVPLAPKKVSSNRKPDYNDVLACKDQVFHGLQLLLQQAANQ